MATSPSARSAARPPPAAHAERPRRLRPRCQVAVEHSRAPGRLGRARFSSGLSGRRWRQSALPAAVELGHSRPRASCGAQEGRARSALGVRCGPWWFPAVALAHMSCRACGSEIFVSVQRRRVAGHVRHVAVPEPAAALNAGVGGTAHAERLALPTSPERAPRAAWPRCAKERV